MKFYGSGIVWNKTNNKRLCKFINGEYETEDKQEINLLIEAGYRSEQSGKTEQGDAEGQEVEAEPEEIEDEGIELEEMTYIELKDLAKVEGVTVGKKSKAELLEALRR